MNNIALTVALATAPSSAFAELRERPRFWFPLLILVFSTVAIVYWYYSVVDIEWLKDLMFSNNPDLQALPADKRAEAMAMLGRGTMLWGSVAGAIFVMPIVLLLSAAYFLMAAKVTKLPLGFKHWFAFSCWTAMPLLLSTIVSAIMLIISDSPQVSPSVMQPLSINELLLHRPMGSPGQSLLESLSIPSLLSWILMIIGVRVWSQRSWAFSMAFILLPAVCLYGIWAFFAFL
jgi:Yip1 domain